MMIAGALLTLLLSFLVIFGVIAIFWAIGVFNRLVRLKNNITKAWSNIDILIIQRSNEIPNLVSIVKGYAEHESEVLTKVTALRSRLDQEVPFIDRCRTNNQITEVLHAIFSVTERCPDLKANERFAALQNRLTGLENEIADRRELYNESVNIFNTRIELFPDMYIAKIMSLRPADMFN